MATSCRIPVAPRATRPAQGVAASVSSSTPGVACRASVRPSADAAPVDVSRRALLALAAVVAGSPGAGAASAAAGKEVGNYLPPAGVDDFVRYVPGPRATPAIRAGTVKPDRPYTFILPASWSEDRVANIQSGNYCQPRCAEPWTEVIFSNAREGRAEVIVSPLERLTPKARATIEEVGTPQGVLESIGQFLTGNYLEPGDVVGKESVKYDDDASTYYTYELNAPDALTGPHILAQITTNGELALMLKVTAHDKQWARNEKRLRAMVASFRAAVPRA